MLPIISSVTQDLWLGPYTAGMLSQWLPVLIVPLTALPILAQSSTSSNGTVYNGTLPTSFGMLDGNFQPARSEAQKDEKDDQIYDELAVDLLEDDDGSGKGRDMYFFYGGNGTVDAGWPKKKNWVSFEDMWDINKSILEDSCLIYDQPLNTESELLSIRGLIDKVAEETKLDHRFILAIILQESGGCVRVPTSNADVRNPGLMQSHNGDGTCNDEGKVSKPCKESEIEEMIRDGVQGTEDGDGLVQCVNDSNPDHIDDVSAFYKAARRYNSGSIADSGDLEDGVATHCYASDVANRLVGWVKDYRECWLDG